MDKLYLITIGEKSFYCAAKNLHVIADEYTNFSKIEVISDRVISFNRERFDLLEKAYKFISNGANSHSIEQKNELEEMIKKHLYD